MKIVAGRLGGRTIVTPKGSATRPMTEKMRAALFDMLGPLDGVIMLDAYAGSGAVGFEALSRGAEQVVGIVPARGAVQAINKNREALQYEYPYTHITLTVESWLANPQNRQRRFNLIVADPPYDQIKPEVLGQLGVLLGKDGIMAVSHSSKIEPPHLEGLQPVKTRSYGDSTISLYQA